VARVHAEQREATLVRLEGLRAAGALSSAHVRLAASGLGVAERTVWRWLTTIDQVPANSVGRPPYRLTDADRAAFAAFRGNVAAVFRARCAVLDGAGQVAGLTVPEHLVSGWAGAEPVALRTLQVAFARELTPAERAAWIEGEHARRSLDVYLRRPATRRNEAWEADHKQLPVLVTPPRGPAVRPWVTTIIDDGTRALVGWALSVVPHTGTVLTALRMALVADPARGPFGGVPTLVRIDRGLDFAAEAVGDALAALCVHPHRLPGYQPHRKGKVERIHLTIEQTLLVGLPGYTDGPRDAAGRLYGPVSDRPADRAAGGEDGAGEDTVGPLRIERFAAQFATWVNWYNTECPHSALDGRTPLQAWNEDLSAVQRIDADRVRHLLLAGVERLIGADGVRWNGLAYVAPELQGRRGQRVQVRYMPHDDRFVEVYLDGAHLCTAYPQGQLTDEQTEQFRAHARAEARRLAGERRRAARRARSALVPLTDQQTTATEARLVPAERVVAPTRSRLDAELRRRSRTDLLGLTDPTTPTAPVDLDQEHLDQEQS
jgi:putative transposase